MAFVCDKKDHCERRIQIASFLHSSPHHQRQHSSAGNLCYEDRGQHTGTGTEQGNISNVKEMFLQEPFHFSVSEMLSAIIPIQAKPML